MDPRSPWTWSTVGPTRFGGNRRCDEPNAHGTGWTLRASNGSEAW